MKWTKLFKYPMQAIVMFAPLFVITCLITVGILCPFPANIILVIFFVWVSAGGDIPFWYGWKKEDRQKFFKNWDAICEGKTHTETLDGEELTVIDSEE